jgi:hypothetical protein
VTWTNDSVRSHTVTADDGSWTSPHVFAGERYAHEFGATGAYPYYCQIHPFMRGEVDVHALLLDTPRQPGAPGRPYTLTGRSSLPAGTDVAIEDGAGATAAHTIVADDGTVRAAVTPTDSTTYRAVASGQASPPVQLLVLDRTITATATRHGDRTIVRVKVTPASPHATVVLQLHLRERFGWWPVRVKHLDSHSRATFRLRLHRRVAARAVLTLDDAATPLARSGELRIGVRSRRHR